MFPWFPWGRGSSSEKQPTLGAGPETRPALGLNVLDASTNSNIIADVVFVHGLRGDSRNTWLSKESNFWWPEILGQDIKEARILTFGYDADVCNVWIPAAQNNVSRIARNMLGGLAHARDSVDTRSRKLIFVAHSLGGLVVQSALSTSRNSAESHISQIFDCTFAITFFGTPHLGSDLALWGSFVSSIANIVKPANKDIVSILKPGSEMLEQIHQDFNSILRLRRDIAITCFYEELTYGSMRRMIVEHQSAIIRGYESYGIHADHMGMTKFSDKNDPGYKAAFGEIRRWVSSVRSAEGFPALSPAESIVLQNLRTSDYFSHKERVPRPVSGTCIWIHQHEKYKTWKNEQKSSLLWLSADPGCGKSVMSRFLIETLQTSEPTTVCYFFFKDDNDEQKSATFALCALLHQLFLRRPLLIEHAKREFTSIGQTLVREFYALWEVFTATITSPACQNVFIIIDGLDECDSSTRRKFMEVLIRFYTKLDQQSTVNNCIKTIITSRPYRSIEQHFHNSPTIRIKTEDDISTIENDIQLVVKAKINELKSFWKLPDILQATLEDRLIQGADRTFLWVSLILNLLAETTDSSERDLIAIINSLPSDLNAVYEQILKGSANPSKAKKILQIIVAATTPLTLDEMQIALAIAPDHKSTEDLMSNLLHEVEIATKDICGLFVRIINSRIYLVHQTARYFLLSDTSVSKPTKNAWKSSICLVEANLVLAYTCASYLSSLSFEDRPLLTSHPDADGPSPCKQEIDNLASKHLFLSYSARNWNTHFKKAKDKVDETLLNMVLTICDTRSNLFDIWFGLYWIYDIKNPWAYFKYPEGLTTLMVGSFFGDKLVVDRLMSKEVDINERDKDDGSALTWAGRGSHLEVTRLLLEAGADVDASDKAGGTALRRATLRSDEPMMRQLLDSGASIETAFESQTPLLCAIYMYKFKAKGPMHMLIEYGANINVKGEKGKTPLIMAIEFRLNSLVERLLEEGADLDVKTERGQTALIKAIKSEDESLVTLLLEKGANTEVRDNYGRTALYFAVLAGNEALVRVLLDNGANVNVRNKRGWTVLHVAACDWNISMIQLLLNYGAAMNMRANDGKTAFHFAAWLEHNKATTGQEEQVTKLLLENGAIVKAQTRDGKTALSMAASRGHKIMADLLVKSGADAKISQKGRKASESRALNAEADDARKSLGTGSWVRRGIAT